ncbi:MAG: nucleoside transporter C-terminal domain-containing protein [Bacteroidales bacterium]|nr:nucleoside transporter C-terminal domain-containing protein [Bacteroidales bacterium]
MNTFKKLTLLAVFLSLTTLLFSQSDSAQVAIDTIQLGQQAASQAAQIAPTDVEVVVPIAPGGISVNSLWRGVLGMITILLIAFAFSKNRKAIDWKVVLIGLAIQVGLAIGVLYVPFIKAFFEIIAAMFVKVMDFTAAGADFVFGSLLDTSKIGYIFAFKVLPTIIFFSALTSLLYYLNVVQVVVVGIAWLLKKAFRLSGAEGLTVAGNIFLGQTEAPLLVKRYLPNMNRSEMFLVMSAGMATIAGAVLTAYIGLLGGDDPQSQLTFAKYLISASVMAAPGVIVIAKIIYPQTESVDTDIKVDRTSVGKNVLDAVSNGTVEGIKVAVNVGGMLIVFIAMVAMLDYILGGLIGHYTGLNDWLASISDGKYASFNFQFVVGMIFTPIAWLMGVANEDMLQIGSLLGTKVMLNEFVAYNDMAAMKEVGAFIYEKSIIMATFLLCGFANISSIGIQIGGISILAPNQRETLTQLGFLSLICGTLASCMSATIVGMILG